MKKYVIVCIIIILTIMVPHNVKAGSPSATFDGSIVPVREFYTGEYASYYDFKINGKFIDVDKDEEIDKYEWKIYPFESAKNGYMNLTLKYLPDMGIDNPRYDDIHVRIPVNVNEFNPDLKRKVYWKIHTYESDMEKIFNNDDFTFRNSLGIKVTGSLTYDTSELKKGVNYVSYEFKPFRELITDYGYETYKTNKGIIKIVLY